MNNPITHFRINNQGSVNDQLNNAYELLGRLEVLAMNAMNETREGAQKIERAVIETLAQAQEERARRNAINCLADNEERKAREEDREREEALQARQGRDTWQRFGNARQYD